MTAIVGYRTEESVWLGADSCGSNGYSRAVYTTSKLMTFEVGQRSGETQSLILGYTTSFRFGQILQHHLSPPMDTADSGSEYIIREIVPAARTVLSEHGWLRKNSEREESGTALIGYRGGLFSLNDDLSVLEPSDSFAAVGSGEDFALGAIHAAAQGKPQAILERALIAASHFASGVMPPFRYLEAP